MLSEKDRLFLKLYHFRLFAMQKNNIINIYKNT